MMRVVLNTNILVSALLSPFGNEALVLQAVQTRKIVPCFTSAMEKEYAEVLARPKFAFPPRQVRGLLDLLRATGLKFEPRGIQVSLDPKDDEFIACALAAHAEFLVTGNKRHFPSEGCGTTKVVSSRELIEHLNTPRFP